MTDLDKLGRYRKRSADPLERFLHHIDVREDGCWVWTASLTKKGYGRLRVTARGSVIAHRFAYERMVGTIPPGMHIDHLCRVRSCVNPEHLEPVTPAENVRRGLTGKVNHRNTRKTHCPQGHPYSGPNLRVDSEGRRTCRACKAAYDRRRSELAVSS